MIILSMFMAIFDVVPQSGKEWVKVKWEETNMKLVLTKVSAFVFRFYY